MPTNKKEAATATNTTDGVLERLFGAMRMSMPTTALVPMVESNYSVVHEEVSAEDRFLSGLAAMLLNYEPDTHRLDKGQVLAAIDRIDQLVDAQLNEILHAPGFQALEASWRGLEDLVNHTNFRAPGGIIIDVIDVDKGELQQDFENNSADIFGGELFKKVYIDEYDQYGGRPYGAMIGLYEFAHTPDDLAWIERMAKVANAAHCPFISSVSPEFFGAQNIDEVGAIKDLRGLLNHPKYGRWNRFRDSEEAAYIGLCLPRYILRLPWDPEKNPSRINFHETAEGKRENYLWGNASLLAARNLVRSFAESGWCQYLRGPKGGGLIDGLPVDSFNLRGQEEIMPPVELAVPDYRELEFADCGFIPLVYRKASGEAAFFSVQSVKRPQRFKDPRDSENSQLASNLSYTFSVTRIAHYIKCIMRDNIGTTADEAYIQRILQAWLMEYVTTAINPDDLTLRYYPFKAAEVIVKSRPGEIGWYDCEVSVLPHIQFEGMNVELRLESRLGAKG